MTHSLPVIDRTAARLGFWAALGGVITFVVFTLCFVGLAVGRPLFLWTNLPDYVAFVRAYPSPLADIARLSMLIFALLFVVLANSIYDLAAPAHKSMARLALSFALAFAVTTGSHYFIQISAVRVSLAHDALSGLEQVVQANPYSSSAAMNMLGWSVFLGLASLCAAPVFGSGGLVRVIRYALIANGVICLMGGAGYVLENTLVVFITMNPLMGGAVLVMTSALAVYFRRLWAGYCVQITASART